jgi:hypothetical protein
MSAVGGRYRAAAGAYFAYGVVYLVGGLYLISQGVGVAGARTSASTTSAMLSWGAIGLVPLIVIPLLLRRPWSFPLRLWPPAWWRRVRVSRRTFAWLVAALLAIRAFKVGEVAVRGGGSVPAPWGGVITFQAGAVVFLVVTLAALLFVLRAAWPREGPPAVTPTNDRMQR